MTEIRSAIADYLAVRRALGYKLADHGWLLTDFASFLEVRGASSITTELALAWATEPDDVLASWWAARLRVVRGLPATWRYSTQPPRSHPWVCCPVVTGGPCPTCIPGPRCRR